MHTDNQHMQVSAKVGHLLNSVLFVQISINPPNCKPDSVPILLSQIIKLEIDGTEHGTSACKAYSI